MLFQFEIREKTSSGLETLRVSPFIKSDDYERVWKKFSDWMDKQDKKRRLFLLINRFTDDGEFDGVIQ